MALGVSPISNDLNRSAMQFQASMLEQLGQQVRQDLRVVQTNRQLGQFAQQIQTVDPAAPDFTQKVTGLMSQYPLAATSPIGSAAINQLGAQRKFIQQQQLQQQDPWRYAGQGVAYNQSTGATKTLFTPTEKPVAQPRPVIIRDRNGAIIANPQTGEEIQRFGDPFTDEQKSSERPTFLNEVQYNRLQPYVAGLDRVRSEIKAAGANPEASHDELVQKFGERGAKWSEQRGFFQGALADDKNSWSDNEAFVRTFQGRYSPAPSIPVVPAPPAGATRQQIEAATSLPVGGGAPPEAVILQPEMEATVVTPSPRLPSREVIAKALSDAGNDKAKAKEILRQLGYGN